MKLIIEYNLQTSDKILRHSGSNREYNCSNYVPVRQHYKGMDIFKRKNLNIKHCSGGDKKTYMKSKPRPILPQE